MCRQQALVLVLGEVVVGRGAADHSGRPFGRVDAVCRVALDVLGADFVPGFAECLMPWCLASDRYLHIRPYLHGTCISGAEADGLGLHNALHYPLRPLCIRAQCGEPHVDVGTLLRTCTAYGRGDGHCAAEQVQQAHVCSQMQAPGSSPLPQYAPSMCHSHPSAPRTSGLPIPCCALFHKVLLTQLVQPVLPRYPAMWMEPFSQASGGC